MNLMKKWLAFGLIMALLLGCAACGSVEENLDKVVDAIDQQVNKEISRGEIDGNVYTSAFSGLTFTATEDWTFASDEEIAQLMNVSMETMGNMNAYQEAISEMATVYDMMATDTLTGTNLSVMYENLSLTGNVGMTEEAYVDSLKSQMELVAGMTWTFEEDSALVTLSGQEYLCFVAYTSYEGIEMQQNYYVRSMDKYMNAVIVTLVDGTDPETVEAMFEN